MTKSVGKNTDFLRKIRSRANKTIHPLRAALIMGNYLANRYAEVVWIVGDGRSGTTWLSELVNYNRRFRNLYEPFFPGRDDRVRGFCSKYIRPECRDETIYEFAREVFTGRFHHYRADSRNNQIFYRGLLIKDVFANLFIKWAGTHFPKVKKVLLMRHPFAVALSKQKFNPYLWASEPRDFLDQQGLYEDYLRCFEMVIRSADGYGRFHKHVMNWSIIHYVPLKQLKEEDVLLVFYEELVAHPERELKRIFSYLYGSDCDQSITSETLTKIKKPSRTSRKDSAIKQGTSLLAGWRTELSRSQISTGLEILRSFGLDRIYNDDLMPDRKGAELFLRA